MANMNGIRIIDCKNISDKHLRDIQDTKEFKAFAEQFVNGMKLNGIVYLINTGIEKDVISNFERKMAEFYSLPFNVKETYQPHHYGLNKFASWGWKGPTTDVLRKDLYTIETFDFTSNPRFEDDSMYPKEIDGFKDAMLAFRKQTRVLSNKLLRSLGEHLELTDKDFFLRQHRATEENYEKSKFSVRSVYYPKESHIPDNVTKFRMPEHQIFGTFTHLHQSSQGGGLQVKLKNGEWVDVPFIPNSIVVKAGKALEMWTGGNIPAVFNRIAWTDKSKTESGMNFGCFLGPDRDACCLAQVKQNPNWQPTYTVMQEGETYDEYYNREVEVLMKFLASKNEGRRENFTTNKV